MEGRGSQELHPRCPKYVKPRQCRHANCYCLSLPEPSALFQEHCHLELEKLIFLTAAETLRIPKSTTVAPSPWLTCAQGHFLSALITPHQSLISSCTMTVAGSFLLVPPYGFVLSPMPWLWRKRSRDVPPKSKDRSSTLLSLHVLI